jgi:MSHA pilin protein MshD
MKPWRSPGASTPDFAPLHPGYNGPAITGKTKGFTLIELIVGIVVLSVGLAGILLVFNQTVAKSADPMLQQQAVALAEGYMDEILGKDYRDCSVSSSPTGSRAERDDVEDYDGVNDSPPRDIRGNVLAGLEGYRVQVSTGSATLNGVTGCRITVTATHDSDAGVRAELVGWRLPD